MKRGNCVHTSFYGLELSTSVTALLIGLRVLIHDSDSNKSFLSTFKGTVVVCINYCIRNGATGLVLIFCSQIQT